MENQKHKMQELTKSELCGINGGEDLYGVLIAVGTALKIIGDAAPHFIVKGEGNVSIANYTAAQKSGKKFK